MMIRAEQERRHRQGRQCFAQGCPLPQDGLDVPGQQVAIEKGREIPPQPFSRDAGKEPERLLAARSA